MKTIGSLRELLDAPEWPSGWYIGKDDLRWFVRHFDIHARSAALSLILVDTNLDSLIARAAHKIGLVYDPGPLPVLPPLDPENLESRTSVSNRA